MPNPENRDPFIELMKKIWLPISGILSAVIFLYQFVQIWRGDEKTITYIVAAIGFAIWIIFLIWIGFSKVTKTSASIILVDGQSDKKTFKELRYPSWHWLARLTLFITLIGTGALALDKIISELRTEDENKFIVAVAQLDGHGESKDLYYKIVKDLESDLGGNSSIKIKNLRNTILHNQGSDSARMIGEENLADIIIWGWQNQPDSSDITLTIEVLSPDLLPTMKSQNIHIPQATIVSLKTLHLENKAGENSSALSYFISGLILYQLNEYESATRRFDQAINLSNENTETTNTTSVYHLYRGNSYYAQQAYYYAGDDYQKAADLNLQFAEAYNNLSVTLYIDRRYQDSIEMSTKAISYSLQIIDAYKNRGVAFYMSSNYNEAIANYDIYIAEKPQDAEIYYFKGLAQANTSRFVNEKNEVVLIVRNFMETAILNFSKAIELNPQYFEAYYHRGLARLDINQYESAINDFNKALEFDPNNEDIKESLQKALDKEGK